MPETRSRFIFVNGVLAIEDEKEAPPARSGFVEDRPSPMGYQEKYLDKDSIIRQLREELRLAEVRRIWTGRWGSDKVSLMASMGLCIEK